MSLILYTLFTWLRTVHCRLSPKRMAIFVRVMNLSSILLSDHVRLGYKVLYVHIHWISIILY